MIGVLALAIVALVLSLYVTFAAIVARSGGSDEEPYSLGVALLVACLPAAGAVCAGFAARRAWRALRGGGAVGAGEAWLIGASFAASVAGVAGVLAAWGWIG
jgi:hypothetical protein